MIQLSIPRSGVAIAATLCGVLLAVIQAPPARGATIAAHVRTPAGAAVADAVIYALPAASSPLPKPALKIPIEQTDREFVPYVSAVQTGTTMVFPNRDPIRHHVYSFSRAKTFEIKLYSGNSPSEILFDQPGVVTLGCNIHDWMIAYVQVVDTPHFAKTDAQGGAQLVNVPPGKYELRVWHPTQKGGGEAQAIVVGQAGMAASFVLDVAPRKLRYKPPLDKMHY